jgi:hypothetical protein
VSTDLNPYRRALPRLTKLAASPKIAPLDREALADALPAVEAKAAEHDVWSANLTMARREHAAPRVNQCRVCQVEAPCPFIIRMERDEP